MGRGIKKTAFLLEQKSRCKQSVGGGADAYFAKVYRFVMCWASSW